jgi:acyl-CoA dehydrogenase
MERRAFGKYLWEHGATHTMIADSAADLQAARLLTLQCASTMDQVGIRAARDQIALIKVAVPQWTYQVVDRAVQLFGGAGVSDDVVLARMLVGLRSLRIADGPDAVHQRTVALLAIQKRKEERKQESLSARSKL